MILTILVFIFVLSILVFVHELGHFAVARLVGVRVEEFGFGLPPRMIGKKIKDTVYSLNWLPIGGFVKLAGEDDVEGEENSVKATKRRPVNEYFWAKSKKQRAAILIAGVTMNFLLAVIITTGLLIDGVKEPAGRIHIETVAPGGPAARAGLVSGDIIESVRLQESTDVPIVVGATKDLIARIQIYADKVVELVILRDGNRQTVQLTPRKNPPKGEGPMGVAISDMETKKYPLQTAPFIAVKINVERGYLMLAGIGDTVWKLIQLKPIAADVAGPIGIAQVTGQAIKFGFRAVLEFASILSLNLAVLNILPIPALDGGRLMFIFVEKFLGRKVKPAFEKQTHQIGMIILLFLVLLVSLNDIMRIARGG